MILRIISIILGIALFAFALKMFIEISAEFFDEFAEEHKMVKESIDRWYRNTKLFMWRNNRKNGVTILSEKKYQKLLKEGKIKYVVIEEEG